MDKLRALGVECHALCAFEGGIDIFAKFCKTDEITDV